MLIRFGKIRSLKYILRLPCNLAFRKRKLARIFGPTMRGFRIQPMNKWFSVNYLAKNTALRFAPRCMIEDVVL